MIRSDNLSKRIAIVLGLGLLFSMLFALCATTKVNAETINIGSATGVVSSKEGVYVRKSASTLSTKVCGLKKGAKVYIRKEVFTSPFNHGSSSKWYQVYTSGKTGYIRSDLVGGIKHHSMKGTIKSTVNYRKGAGTGMANAGVLKKGSKVTVLLTANRKGSSDTWYKFKKGNSYYYVRAVRVKLATKITSFDTEGLTTPKELRRGSSFKIKGKVICNKDIEKVEVNITNDDGETLVTASAKPSIPEYNISALDSKIKFGSLKVGNYSLNIIITADGANGEINKPFVVKPIEAYKRIVNKALELAWPAGTSASKYTYTTKGSSATPAFQKAIDLAYPDRSRWSAAPKVGASCDVFVGTVIRASGVDPDYPRGLDEQWPHLEGTCEHGSDIWTEVQNFDRTVGMLKSGDIVIYKRSGGGGHTFIYFNKNGQSGLIEASLSKKYGMVVTGDAAVQKKLNYKLSKIKVFRALED